MSFLEATNVVASWPPERRPTGTPHARAKMWAWGVGEDEGGQGVCVYEGKIRGGEKSMT